MTESARDEMRRLLKTFGIHADEAVVAHLARTPRDHPFKVRLTLTDLTEYGPHPPEMPLHLEIEGTLHP